ncbi:conjugal transfer ATP-binding protein TraC [Raoultella planticola]|uniref:Conjugal transfer ATP-binding protein TraC n=1 Tax=Raoultella planticola TaxID=575 RepID=A0A485D3V5_RAOPL|nr:conjugal transfer ATP-binding protein TraC [Raoultella planticola]
MKKSGPLSKRDTGTARRHLGSYITITQNIVDFDSPTASSAARAAWGNSSYKAILKQSAKEFAKYNQLYPDQFTPMQRDMINSFGSAKDQWFSSFMLQVEAHTSWHRLFVDPLSRQCTPRAAAILSTSKAVKERELTFTMRCMNWPPATFLQKWQSWNPGSPVTT